MAFLVVFFGPKAAQCSDITLQDGCIFLPAAGYRYCWNGSLDFQNKGGSYWSSSVNSTTHGWCLSFVKGSAINDGNTIPRSSGYSVRCIKTTPTPPSPGMTTVTIAGAKWLQCNLIGVAGTNAGHVIASQPWHYSNFFKWGDSWVYQRASSTSDGMQGTDVGNASTSPSITNTGSTGYDYAQGLSGGRASGDPCKKLGAAYRTPTRAQFQALVASGKSAWTAYQDVNGYFLGPNAGSCNSSTIASGCIFFPAAGSRYRADGLLNYEGIAGRYWSSSVSSITYVHCLWFNSDTVDPKNYAYRGEGYAVRCVEDETLIWAAANLGASNPQDYGNFYKWGDTFAYGHASSTTDGMGDGTSVGNASTSPAASGTGGLGYDYGLGLSGGRASGDPCKSLGSNWRTPTRAQFQELVASGKSAWTTYQNVKGYFFGPSATSCTNTTIQPDCYFFPAAGYRGYFNGSLSNEGGEGNYWSSSVHNDTYSYSLGFISGGVYPDSYNGRGTGFSVRCVYQ